ncbi:MAG: DUF1573 domain-containing protein [Chitinophagaceae bacterium]
MKSIVLIITFLIAGFAVIAQDQKPEDVIKVSTDKYDFGKVKQGVPVTTYFNITNKSGKTIFLENVTASCGCTTPEWSKEPIKAGASTKIKVGYNAAALNRFEKDVTIKIAGVQQPKVIKITGDVLEPAAYETYVKQKGSKKTKGKKTDTAKT